ncbi:MAG: hypothetical protein LBK25_06275 [Treponema sp.]|nr:hypothetical protein [Treponema sp.]
MTHPSGVLKRLVLPTVWVGWGVAHPSGVLKRLVLPTVWAGWGVAEDRAFYATCCAGAGWRQGGATQRRRCAERFRK